MPFTRLAARTVVPVDEALSTLLASLTEVDFRGKV
jgi:hypothetical protein